MVIVGLVAGLIFGLLFVWGTISILLAGVGVVVLIIGSLAPTMFRSLFAVAILGFLLSFVIGGGLSLL
jgi:hypothetical protein